MPLSLLGTSPAQAHHELGAAFIDDEISIEGTVVEYNFKNPHANIILSVADTLVVETDRLLSNLTGTEGNAVSDRHTVVESYRRVDDEIGPAVEMLMVVNDPDYLASPWEIRWNKYYVSDYEFTELDCRLPFFAN